MSLDLDPNHIFRDFVTDGLPASGTHDPRKVEIRQHLSSMWQAVIALLADADPDLTLPNLLIRYTVTGGTADAIEAAPNLTPPSGPGLALFSIQIAQDNTGPVTINGKPWRTNGGSEFVAGGIKAGGIYLLLDNGSHYRSVTDQDLSALVAAAEDATERSEQARDTTLAALSGVVSPKATLAMVTADAPATDPEYYDVAWRDTNYVAGSGATYRRVTTEPSHAGKVQNGNGTWYEIRSDSITPQMFGAKADGINDDTASIIAGDSYCRGNQQRLNFPPGVYMVSQLTIHPHANWLGDMRGTVLRQIIGSNVDLLYGVDSNENWGAPTSNTGMFAHSFTIDGFTLDGNWNGGPKFSPSMPGNVTGSGYAVMGDHCIVRNIIVTNCAEHGMRTEFQADHNLSYDQSFVEATFDNIRIDYVGKHGWWFAGPHDAVRSNITVLDSSQQGENGWDNFFNEKSSAREIAIHGATRSGRLHPRFCVSLMNGAMHEFSGGCNIEGGYAANLYLASAGSLFDSSTRFYAAWSGVNVHLAGESCRQNIIRGMLQPPPVGRPDCVGILFGADPADRVFSNDIEVFMVNQNNGLVQFNIGDYGGNKVQVRGSNAANVGILGEPHPSSDVLVRATVNLDIASGSYAVNTLDQSEFIPAIPAGGSFEWTFAYPFQKNPNVQITIVTPASGATHPLWVSGLSPTSVTIFNPNSSEMPVQVRASTEL